VVFQRPDPNVLGSGTPCVKPNSGNPPKPAYVIEQDGTVSQCVMTSASIGPKGSYFHYTAIVDGAVSDPGIAHTN